MIRVQSRRNCPSTSLLLHADCSFTDVELSAVVPDANPHVKSEEDVAEPRSGFAYIQTRELRDYRAAVWIGSSSNSFVLFGPFREFVRSSSTRKNYIADAK